MEGVGNTANKTPSDRYRFNLEFFKRFTRLLPWLFPSWKSPEVLLFLLLLCLGLLEQYIIYNIGFVPSKFYKVLGEKDHAGFWKETVIAVILITVEAFIKSTTLFVSSFLYLNWRSNITRSLHAKYFKEVLYYTINVIDKTVDNPDQRMTQDVDKLCDTFSQIVAPIIISPFTIVYYTYKSQQSSGYVGPVGVLIFFIIATVINKFLMSPVVKFIFKKEKMEGNFRFKHMQIRSNSESAAFYRSGAIENEKTNTHLTHLLDTQHKLIWRQYALNFSVNLFDYLGSIFSYLAISFPIFVGAYDSLSSTDLSVLISGNAFVVMYLIHCFTKLIDLSVEVTTIAGTTHRVVELVEVLNRLQERQETEYYSRPTESRGFGWSEMETLVEHNQLDQSEVENDNVVNNGPITAIQISDVTYNTPSSKDNLCTGLSFKFESGCNILVTGNSGCGKSSLLRVINGIWPEVRGTIDHMVDLKPNIILFLPQKPYFTDGSLRQQICYPLRSRGDNGMNDEVIHQYLLTLDLTHICTRVGGLDTHVDWNWYDQLSPGEMQRLSFLRLFYHQPKFAVLDEATSQIGFDAEQTVYTMCNTLNITVLSVGHRDSLRPYHHVELHFDGQGSYHIKPILNLQASAVP